MFVYLLVCMLITFITLEIFVGQGNSSSDQRLLPLLLGLICVYNFYLIVEYITGEVEVFKVLNYLMVIQVLFLIFYYVLDFLQIALPLSTNIIVLSIMCISNGFICLDLMKGSVFLPYIITGLAISIIIIIIFATASLIYSNFNTKVNTLYYYLYVAFLFPAIGLVLVFVFNKPYYYVMPAALAIFCCIISFLLLTHRFEDTSKFIKEDIFNKFDSALIIFDADFNYISATSKAEELFSYPLRIANNGRGGNPYKSRLKEWVGDSPTDPAPIVFSDAGRHYKASIEKIKTRGRVQGYIITVIDFTEEISKVQSAKELAAARGEFLANMSHELRSPLHAIIGGIDIMASSGKMSAKNLEISRSIMASGYNLLGIVNSILDYSKVENSLVNLAPINYDLWEAMRQQVQNYLLLLDSKDIEFEMRIEDALPKMLIGDENRIRSIVQNLVTNAIKYTREGSIVCTLKCEEEAEDKVRIIFSVKDTGVGISEDFKKRLFKKYESLSHMGAESTGIGLYLVKYLTELMDGGITVESDGKTGSTFTVNFVQEVASKDRYLPCVFDKNTLFFDRRNISKTIEPTFTYPGATILMVDDMKVNREILRGKLMPWAVNVIEATSGAEAIDMVEKNPPDLILMDHMMPQMSGIEASVRIKQMAKVPIVLVTANISDGMQKEVVKNGLDGFIGKPIDSNRLKMELEELLPENLREMPMMNLAGISAFGPNDRAYQLTLQAYVEELIELLDTLKDLYDNDFETFEVKVHGIKGISRQIGRQQLGIYSEIMEMAAKSEHRPFIERFMPDYFDELRYAIVDAQEELKMFGM